MAQQPGYPPQGYANNEQYGNGAQPEYEAEPPAGQAAGHGAGGGRRKRQYAGQAYDFGAGANSALGGQPQAGGSFSSPPGVGYEGYNPATEQPGYQQPVYGAEVPPIAAGQPGYRAPSVGGYQAPDIGYPAHGATSMLGGVAGITQGVNQMGIQPQQAAQGAQRPHLNQLYPTDMLNQPFNVAELDLPPPLIVLPPNVRTVTPACRGSTHILIYISIVKCHTLT
jgi:protein transport protein SEC24